MLRRMAARCGERGWSARVLYVHQPWNPHFRLRLGADRRVRPRAPRSCLYLESGGRRLARLSAPGQPCCSDAGWVSDSPRWCRKAPQIAQHPGKIPPEFPRAIISRLENGPGSHGFNGFQAPFQEPENRLRGKLFGSKNSPRNEKALPVLPGQGFNLWSRGLDLNQRPPGYEPGELPDCSTPHYSGTHNVRKDILAS